MKTNEKSLNNSIKDKHLNSHSHSHYFHICTYTMCKNLTFIINRNTYWGVYVSLFWLVLTCMLIISSVRIILQSLIVILGLGFQTMLGFVYSGDMSAITSITDLSLLVDIFKLADKVLVILHYLKKPYLCFTKILYKLLKSLYLL